MNDEKSPGERELGGEARRVSAARRLLSPDDYVRGVLARDRVIIGRTFTLIESAQPAHREVAEQVLQKLLPHAGGSIRIGVTGPPGSGKSTLIEALGTMLLDQGKHVAVLAIDPSSEISGGSILGDKTRMNRLSTDARAIVRPSPGGRNPGGVARGTRDSIIVCEAAGYEVVFVETIGVGQSETAVASMVDFFLLLMIAGAGDELQGIKRGVMELADCFVINKAEGANRTAAESSRAEYSAALRLLQPASEGWQPPVLLASALTREGVEEVWATIVRHRELLLANGRLDAKRRAQSSKWFHQTFERLLLDRARSDAGVRAELPKLDRLVAEGALSPFAAAEKLLTKLHHKQEPDK